MKEAIIQYNDNPDADDNQMVISWKPLVRCKDCIYGKHEKNESTGMEWVYCGHHRENRPKEWFCASGSRI